jgi:hypothetical protein
MKLLNAAGLIQSEQDRAGAGAVLRAANIAAVATPRFTLVYYAMLILRQPRLIIFRCKTENDDTFDVPRILTPGTRLYS